MLLYQPDPLPPAITDPPKLPTRVVRVEVTREDINAKYPYPSSPTPNCPVAAAITRHAGFQAKVGWVCWVGTGGGVGSLPLSAQQFINAYDRKMPVEPFSFDLEVPIQ